MNIYELNNLIATIEDPKHFGHDMLNFYLNMRRELMAKLSKGITKIIKSNI